MNWLIVVPKETSLNKLKETLSIIEVEFNEEFSPIEFDEKDYVVEVIAGLDFPGKLEGIDASLQVYPNSEIDLY